MPLIEGKSKATRNTNIAEMLHSYKKKGKIGTSNPENIRAAISQASAIAYAKQRKK